MRLIALCTRAKMSSLLRNHNALCGEENLFEISDNKLRYISIIYGLMYQLFWFYNLASDRWGSWERNLFCVVNGRYFVRSS